MFPHTQLWQSVRAEHTKVKEPHPDDSNTYEFICYKCEAQLRLSEPGKKSEVGRKELEVIVLSEMALQKRRKHKARGSMFKEALLEIKAEKDIGRAKRRRLLSDLFQKKVSDALHENLRSSNAMKHFLDFHKKVHRIARAEEWSQMKEDELWMLFEKLSSAGVTSHVQQEQGESFEKWVLRCRDFRNAVCWPSRSSASPEVHDLRFLSNFRDFVWHCELHSYVTLPV